MWILLSGVSRTQRISGRCSLRQNVGGALDEVGGDAVGDAGQGAHAAGEDDHGVSGIGTAGDVGSDVGVGLLVNFAGGFAKNLVDQVAAAAEGEFFGHDAQGAVGGDEVYGMDSLVAFGCG